jgi:hypothetical protein
MRSNLDSYLSEDNSTNLCHLPQLSLWLRKTPEEQKDSIPICINYEDSKAAAEKLKNIAYGQKWSKQLKCPLPCTNSKYDVTVTTDISRHWGDIATVYLYPIKTRKTFYYEYLLYDTNAILSAVS